MICKAGMERIVWGRLASGGRGVAEMSLVSDAFVGKQQNISLMLG